MPIYEYSCKTCNRKFELLRRFSDTAEVTCPKCGSVEVVRKISTFSCGMGGPASGGSGGGCASGARVSS